MGTPTKNPKTHVCHLCPPDKDGNPVCFTSKGNLKQHLESLIHLKIRPFQCNTCENLGWPRRAQAINHAEATGHIILRVSATVDYKPVSATTTTATMTSPPASAGTKKRKAPPSAVRATPPKKINTHVGTGAYVTAKQEEHEEGEY